MPETPSDEQELWQEWNTFAWRTTWQRMIDRDGTQEMAERALADLPEVSALDALSANQQLVDLLVGRRWYVMQAAREAGATWDEIGEALSMSKQGAYDWYSRKVADQEHYVGDVRATERARAVLDTPEPTTSESRDRDRATPGQ
jgi:hypothetical protein